MDMNMTKTIIQLVVAMLLIVPVEKNKKMPALMRPYVDLYFIYSASAVVIKEKQ